MPNSIEQAALAHISEKSPGSLRGLYESLLEGSLLVPTFAETSTDEPGRTDIPVRAVRLPDGRAAIVAYTTVSRFLEYLPPHSRYVELNGRVLFKMVTEMSEIDCIWVNFSERAGTPRGKLTRPEFELLANGEFPVNN